MQISTNSQFITLTYNDNNLPLNNSLDKRDIQLFFKRLRKNLSNDKNQNNQRIRYIAVGEYGTKFSRPHYHILLFNAPPHQHIEKAWNKGFTSTSNITHARIKYTFKYIQKPKTNPAGTSKIREFQLQSRGIGSNYLTPQMIEYHNRDIKNCYITKFDGHQMSIPKYYKNKLYNEQTQLQVTNYQKQRIDAIQTQQIANLMQKYRIDEKTSLQKLELSKLNTKFEPQSQTKF